MQKNDQKPLSIKKKTINSSSQYLSKQKLKDPSIKNKQIDDIAGTTITTITNIFKSFYNLNSENFIQIKNIISKLESNPKHQNTPQEISLLKSSVLSLEKSYIEFVGKVKSSIKELKDKANESISKENKANPNKPKQIQKIPEEPSKNISLEEESQILQLKKENALLKKKLDLKEKNFNSTPRKHTHELSFIDQLDEPKHSETNSSISNFTISNFNAKNSNSHSKKSSGLKSIKPPIPLTLNDFSVIEDEIIKLFNLIKNIQRGNPKFSEVITKGGIDKKMTLITKSITSVSTNYNSNLSQGINISNVNTTANSSNGNTKHYNKRSPLKINKAGRASNTALKIPSNNSNSGLVLNDNKLNMSFNKTIIQEENKKKVIDNKSKKSFNKDKDKDKETYQSPNKNKTNEETSNKSKKEIENLNKYITELEQKISSYKEKNNELIKKIELKEVEIQDKNYEIINSIDESTEQILQLTNKNIELSNKIESLQKKIDNLTTNTISDNQMPKRERELSALKKKNTELDEQIKNLNKVIIEKDKSITNIKIQKEKIENELNNTSSKFSQEKDLYQKEISSLKEQISFSKGQIQQTASIESEMISHKEEIKTLKSSIDDLTKKLLDKTTTQVILNKEIQNSNELISNLKSKISDLEKLIYQQNDIVKSQKQFQKDLNETINSMKEILKEKDEVIREKAKTIEELQKAIANMGKIEREIEEKLKEEKNDDVNKKNIIEQNKTIKELNKKVSELSKQKDDLNRKMEEMINQKEKSKLVEQSSQREKNKYNDEMTKKLISEKEALKDKINKFTNEIEQYKKKVKDSEEQNNTNRKKISDIEKERNTLRLSIEEKTNENNKITKEYNEYKETTQSDIVKIQEKLSKTIKDKDAQIKTLENKISEKKRNGNIKETLEKTVSQLKEDIKTKEQTIQELTKSSDENIKTIKSLQEDNIILKKKNYELVLKEDQLNQEIEELKSQIEKMDLSLINLEKQLEIKNDTIIKKDKELELSHIERSKYKKEQTDQSENSLTQNELENTDITPEKYEIVKCARYNKYLQWYLLKLKTETSNDRSAFGSFIWKPIMSRREFKGFENIPKSTSFELQKKIESLQDYQEELLDKLSKKEKEYNKLNLQCVKFINKNKSNTEQKNIELVSQLEKLKNDNRYLLEALKEVKQTNVDEDLFQSNIKEKDDNVCNNNSFFFEEDNIEEMLADMSGTSQRINQINQTGNGNKININEIKLMFQKLLTEITLTQNARVNLLQILKLLTLTNEEIFQLIGKNRGAINLPK